MIPAEIKNFWKVEMFNFLNPSVTTVTANFVMIVSIELDTVDD